jgi:hypothetical protein
MDFEEKANHKNNILKLFYYYIWNLNKRKLLFEYENILSDF